MAGTYNGGLSAAETIKKRYGSDFYKRIGAIGGRAGNTGGFYGDKERARIAGIKGGKIGGRRSKRGKARA